LGEFKGMDAVGPTGLIGLRKALKRSCKGNKKKEVLAHGSTLFQSPQQASAEMERTNPKGE
jgi:hypothetical protein